MFVAKGDNSLATLKNQVISNGQHRVGPVVQENGKGGIKIGNR